MGDVAIIQFHGLDPHAPSVPVFTSCPKYYTRWCAVPAAKLDLDQPMTDHGRAGDLGWLAAEPAGPPRPAGIGPSPVRTIRLSGLLDPEISGSPATPRRRGSSVSVTCCVVRDDPVASTPNSITRNRTFAFGPASLLSRTVSSNSANASSRTFGPIRRTRRRPRHLGQCALDWPGHPSRASAG
jgi:hypothetical protein